MKAALADHKAGHKSLWGQLSLPNWPPGGLGSDVTWYKAKNSV